MVGLESRAPDALERLGNLVLDAHVKGLPAELIGSRLRDVGEVGLHALRDLVTPALLLHDSALEHNIRRMARFCAEHRVSIAPHGKTTMAPQLVDRQLRAGAWGISAATVHQAATMAAYGVGRIVLANEVTDPRAIAWLPHILSGGVRLLVLVDSVEGVTLLNEGMARGAGDHPLEVLVEVGMDGGRAGSRTDAAALRMANAVGRAQHLRLAGVEAFEGVAGRRSPGAQVRVDELLERVARVAGGLAADGFEVDAPIVTAGGSVWFDRVADLRDGVPSDAEIVLRSGCYLTHDHGAYARSSPFTADDDFRPALELVASVLSCPEHGLAIVNMGKRDAPYDSGLPVPLWTSDDGTRRRVSGDVEVLELNDQHAYVRIADGVRPGQQIGFGISHPCTAFDKWRVIFRVSDDDRVTGAVATLF